MRILVIALLCLGTAWGQAASANQNSDHQIFVGNQSQPVDFQHRSTIAQAIQFAGPQGVVWIPPNYQGSDCNPLSSCNPGTTLILDFRNNQFTTYPPLAAGAAISGTPSPLQIAQFLDASHIKGVTFSGDATVDSTGAVTTGTAVHKNLDEFIGGAKTFGLPITVNEIDSGSVNPMSIESTDQPTPTSFPSPGDTWYYTNNGKVCALDPSGNETCTGQTPLKVNGVPVPLANVNDAVPSADAGYVLGKWLVSAPSVAVELPIPVVEDCVSSTTADSAGINTSETIVGQTPQYPSNSFVAGTVFHITAWGRTTDTVANASTFKVRIGSGGTTSDAAAVTLTTGASGTSGTNVAFNLDMDITIRGTGSGTSATLTARNKLFSGNAGIQGATSQSIGSPTLAGFDTTAANFISLTYVSAATTTTSTFEQVTICRTYL
jgi:hypothetical protein